MKAILRSLGIALAIGFPVCATAFINNIWIDVPSSAATGQAYSVDAGADSDNGTLYDLYVSKDGQYFGEWTGYDWSASVVGSDQSNSAGTVTYEVDGYDNDSSQSTSTSINIYQNNPPSPTLSVDGHASGDTIMLPASGSVTITVRYRATDPDGNLSGIRPQVWNDSNRDGNYASGEYFDNNGGNFVGQSGGSGEVDRTITLNATGNWYLWTDAQDTIGAFANSGAWTGGFYLNVVSNTQPVGSFDSATGSLNQNQTLSGSGWAADNEMGAPVDHVDIRIDGSTVTRASLGDNRSDVQQANVSWGHWSSKDITYSGWHFSYNIGNLGLGSHTVTAVAWDNAGGSSSIGSKSFTVNQNSPPAPSISVDAHRSGDAIYVASGGSSSVTVRYSATDPDNNLTGIRFNAWNQTTGWFDNNSGNYVGESGGSGEVDRTFSLNEGDWYFWTDAEDGAGANSSTGPWTSGFHIHVVAAAAPSTILSASTMSASCGQSVTLTSTTISSAQLLVNQAIDISTDNSNWTSGWNDWSGQTHWSGGPTGSNPLSVTWTPSQTGTYYFRARGQDSLGQLSSFSFVTVTVTPASQSVSIQAASSSVNSGGSVRFTASGGNTGYIWSVSPSGPTGISGTVASQTITFPSAGTYTVSVYAPASANYAQSNTARATVNVTTTLLSQPTVFITPGTDMTVSIGTAQSFTASGGGGTGAFVWTSTGNVITGTGSTKSYTFNANGAFQIRVQRDGDAAYNPSNTAIVTITVVTPHTDTNNSTQLKLLAPTP